MIQERPPVLREKLPGERASIDRRFHIRYQETEHDPGNLQATRTVTKSLKMFVVAGMYEDGRIGELFVHTNKQGELINGTLETMATMMSLGLQHGVPLGLMTAKMRGTQFPPAQFIGLDDPDFRKCTSVIDLIAQWLDMRFPEGKYHPAGTGDK